MHVISIVIYYLFALVALIVTPLLVPGTYVILGATLLFSIIYGFDPFPWPVLLLFVVLTALGELVEFLDGAMRQEAFHITHSDSGARIDVKGWWDSMANSNVCNMGDRLVELGLWERHPDGYGRRWFYRPLQKASDAR